MHDIKAIRDNPDAFDAALTRRGSQYAGTASRLIALDEVRRTAILALEQAQARRNAASKEIGEAKKAKDEARANALMAEVNDLKTRMGDMEQAERDASKALNDALVEIPNLPLAEVPEGADEQGNVEHHKFGAKRDYAFTPKQHFELGEALGQMDFETAAKLSGARFVVLKSGLARLERALGQFMLDLHTGEHGYTEVNPPLLVRDDAMFGTAQLPKFRDDQFPTSREPFDPMRFTSDALIPAMDEQGVTVATMGEQPGQLMAKVSSNLEKLIAHERLWLIPTAEVPLTNLVREAITDEAELPLRLTALTQCFRAEAGAAGRDTRGMIRQHQFTKVEMVSITTPEESKNEHERMLACAEEVLRRLDLHYRVVTLCTGDMGFASQKTYDIEVWLPGQGMYREISSCSVCGDFQAQRMKARYKGRDGKVKGHVHTLNGSGVAVGRALIAVMETYQQADGSIAVPDVLQNYMGGLKVIGQ
ncbi:MAG TPA: serine--tRNA ligase [Hyphomicrobium sp.]|nr:serine--tRNA ligase [Hyphomicrobium sp.]